MTTPTHAPSFASSTWLVAEREIMARLRSKAFVISTIILFVITIGALIIGGLTVQNQSDAPIAAVGEASSALDGVDGYDVTEVGSVDEAKTLVEDGDADAALIPDDSAVGIAIIADTEAPTSLMMQLSITPKVTLLDTSAENPLIAYFVAIGFGLVFFMSAMTFGQVIAQSVVEEKQTRVVEILMSAIPVRSLLAGKVLGNSILAFGQIAVLAVLSIIGLSVIGQSELLLGLGAPIVWFVGFFAIGFILLAAMFAATGSMVSRQEDIGSTTTPVTMLVMLPYFLVIFFHDNPLVLGIMSYVPFSAPVGMPMRLFLGTAEWWEPLLSLLVLAASAVIVVFIGSRIYENSLLKMGSRVKWGEALSR
ncbi:ABC transporter permease [Paramicrobacterium fandaimingii]|uniref:ABC transporter permease n=1 Tax=Paramicrobacterium fandaimingii TaxID=2708079 RepID=UPI0014248D0C|nr:ABC transporter permease [Microbacterium fandaimingii]